MQIYAQAVRGQEEIDAVVDINRNYSASLLNVSRGQDVERIDGKVNSIRECFQRLERKFH